jgi:hypothetical protein
MTTFNKKVFKGLPAAIRVRKPRYNYQDLIIKETESKTIQLNLEKFPGVPYIVDESVVSLEYAALWDRTDFTGGVYTLAPRHTEEVKTIGGYSVIGSPVFQGTVVNGFSSSDYIALPYVELGKGNTGSWEINFKVTPANADLTIESSIMATSIDARGIRIGTAGSTKGRWQFLVSTGNGWINASSHYGSHVVQAGVTYWLKAGYDAANSKYYLKYSTDGIEYINDVSYNSTTKIGNFSEQIGYCDVNKVAWSGSIDLSGCSFTDEGKVVWQPTKIETTATTTPIYLTKSKRFFYNIYGTPTIEDHVVSDFSKSNYICMPVPFQPAADTYWEIFTKFTTGSTFMDQAYLFGQRTTNYSTPQICTMADGTLKLYLAKASGSWSIANGLQSTEKLEPETTYYMSTSYDGAGIYKVLVQKEGTDTWVEFFNIASTNKVYTVNTNQLIFGYDDGNGVWNGSIDLKECYVKVGSEKIWGIGATFIFEGEGCLQEGTDNNTSPITYYAFKMNNGETLLSKFDWFGPDYTWVGDIKTQSRLVYPMYKKNFKEVGSLTKDPRDYYYTGFASGKYALASNVNFDPAKDTILLMTRVKTGDDGSNRAIFTNALNNWLLHTGSSKKWYLWNGVTSVGAGSFEYNTWYYVLIRQTPTQTVMYYMLDDGTYPELDNKFPLDLDQWTMGPSQAQTIFTYPDIRIGLNIKDAEPWEGQIDMLNTAIYKSVPKYFEGPDIYSKVWSALEEV